MTLLEAGSRLGGRVHTIQVGVHCAVVCQTRKTKIKAQTATVNILHNQVLSNLESPLPQCVMTHSFSSYYQKTVLKTISKMIELDCVKYLSTFEKLHIRQLHKNYTIYIYFSFRARSCPDGGWTGVRTGSAAPSTGSWTWSVNNTTIICVYYFIHDMCNI